MAKDDYDVLVYKILAINPGGAILDYGSNKINRKSRRNYFAPHFQARPVRCRCPNSTER